MTGTKIVWCTVAPDGAICEVPAHEVNPNLLMKRKQSSQTTHPCSLCSLRIREINLLTGNT